MQFGGWTSGRLPHAKRQPGRATVWDKLNSSRRRRQRLPAALPCFTPDVSILVWNKDLFKKAGLDPEKAPTTLAEIHADATKIRALGGDTYGYYFAGSCPGCNIFVTSPMMVAAGAKILPAKAGDTPLDGEGVKDVLTEMQAMWKEGLIPASAQADAGANFVANFQNGNIGIQSGGGFLTDEAQLEGLAKNNIIPSRPSLADNKYFKAEPRVVTTAKALGVGYVPWVFHFNDMVNSDSSPWIQMIQTAIFDGDVDGAIATARDAMKSIAAE